MPAQPARTVLGAAVHPVDLQPKRPLDPDVDRLFDSAALSRQRDKRKRGIGSYLSLSWSEWCLAGKYGECWHRKIKKNLSPEMQKKLDETDDFRYLV